MKISSTNDRYKVDIIKSEIEEEESNRVIWKHGRNRNIEKGRERKRRKCGIKAREREKRGIKR